MRPLESVRSRRSPADWLDALLGVPLALAVAGTGFGFASDYFWIGEIATHFRVQWAGTLVLLAVALAVRRRWLVAGFAFGLAAVNAAVVVPDLLPDARLPRAGAAHLRVLAVNVFIENKNFAAVARLVEERDADVVGLVEPNQEWLDELGPALARYPSHFEMPGEGALGIGLWSRRPLQRAQIRYFGNGGMPAVVATVRLEDQDVTLVLLHLWPPKNPDLVDLRDHAIADLAFSRDLFAGELVVFGDLNLTPWSSSFKFLEDALGVRDTRQGFGLQATWPADKAVLAIPIDHCLTTPGLLAVRREVGPRVGSDHLPLFVDLTFAH